MPLSNLAVPTALCSCATPVTMRNCLLWLVLVIMNIKSAFREASVAQRVRALLCFSFLYLDRFVGEVS